MENKPSNSTVLLRNNKLSYDFTVIETVVAGMKLDGSQTKAIASNCFAIKGARVIFTGSIGKIIGVSIDSAEAAPILILLSKKQISRLIGAVAQTRLTIMVDAITMERGKFKAVLALCKGKTHHDKRESTKNADIDKRLRSMLNHSTK